MLVCHVHNEQRLGCHLIAKTLWKLPITLAMVGISKMGTENIGTTKASHQRWFRWCKPWLEWSNTGHYWRQPHEFNHPTMMTSALLHHPSQVISSSDLLLDHSNQGLHHLDHLWWLALVMPKFSVPILLIPTIARVVRSVPIVFTVRWHPNLYSLST